MYFINPGFYIKIDRHERRVGGLCDIAIRCLADCQVEDLGRFQPMPNASLYATFAISSSSRSSSDRQHSCNQFESYNHLRPLRRQTTQPAVLPE